MSISSSARSGEKILIISGAFPPMPSGESTNTLYLANHLATLGADVHVLTRVGNIGPAGPGVTIHPVMTGWGWRSAREVARFVRDLAPASVLIMYIGFIYDFHPMMTFFPTLLRRMAPNVQITTRFEHTKVAWVPKGMLNGLLLRAARKVMSRIVRTRDTTYHHGTLIRDSDQVIVLAKEHKQDLLLDLPAASEKITVIPPPPNMHVGAPLTNDERIAVRESLGIEPDAELAVFVGYVYPAKRFDILIPAFRKVVDTHPRARLLVLGGELTSDLSQPVGYLDEMKQLAATLGISDRITWMGSYDASNGDMSRYLYASDISVLLFRLGIQMNNSSFSSVAAHGLPVVSTAGPETDAALVHERNIYFGSELSADAIGAAIDRVLSDAVLRNRLREGVAELADEYFSWPRAAERTLDVLTRDSRQAPTVGHSRSARPARPSTAAL